MFIEEKDQILWDTWKILDLNALLATIQLTLVSTKSSYNLKQSIINLLFLLQTTVIEASCAEYGREYLDKMIKDIDKNCPSSNNELIQIPTTNGNVKHHRGSFVSNDIEFNVKNLKAKSTNWDQFCTLLKRNMIQILRNRKYLALKFYMHVFLGFLLGSTFYQIGNDASQTLYNFGFCFTVLIAFMYIPLMPVLLECK